MDIKQFAFEKAVKEVRAKNEDMHGTKKVYIGRGPRNGMSCGDHFKPDQRRINLQRSAMCERIRKQDMSRAPYGW